MTDSTYKVFRDAVGKVGYRRAQARDAAAEVAAAEGDLPPVAAVRRTSPPCTGSRTSERFRQDAFVLAERSVGDDLGWLQTTYVQHGENLTAGMDLMERVEDGVVGTMTQAEAEVAAQVVHRAVQTSTEHCTPEDEHPAEEDR